VPVSGRYDCTDRPGREEGIKRAAQAVSAGDLVVLPTDTVYGIGCDAFSPAAVERLLAAKGRGRAMPPPVLVPHARTLDGIATDIADEVYALAEAFWPGGLTLVVPMQPTLNWDLGDTGGTVAARMPLHPVALELLDRTGPMAVSSANLTGSPAARTADEAREQLGESVAVYLEAGEAGTGVPSTIVDGTGATLRVLRDGAVSLAELREVVPSIVGAGEQVAP
jgi:L-threonylcarbamoyladenylate synthase